MKWIKKVFSFIREIYSWENLRDAFRSDPAGAFMIFLVLYVFPGGLLFGMIWNNFLHPLIWGK